VTPQSLPIGSSYTPRHTPLHVTQLVMFFLKTTFAQQSTELPDFVWQYAENDYENNRIAFDMGYNPDSKVYGARPTVVVNRTNVQNQVMGLNREASYANMPQGTDTRFSIVRSGVQILIKSKKYEETDILGNYIYSLLLAFRPYLPKLTGVLQVQDVTLSGITRYSEDDTYYVGNIMINYLMQINWKHTISAEQLKSIAFNLVEMDKRDERKTVIS